MQLNIANQQKLQAALTEHDFTHALPYLLKTAKQGIRFVKIPASAAQPASSSRIGGNPALPPSTEWPLTADGTAMSFLTQLNLADTKQHDASDLLPAAGMLYFFVGVDEPAYNIEHKVLYVPEAELSQLQYREAPGPTTLEESFNAFSLRGRSSIELPNYSYVDEEEIEDDEHDYDQYEDLLLDINDEEDGVHDVAIMFGYPTGQHGDSEYEASLNLLTGKDYSYSTEEAQKQITAHLGGNEQRALQEIQDTLLLLEIESDNGIGFCWWDAGVLQYFIRKEDLLAGRFDKCYCSLYSS